MSVKVPVRKSEYLNSGDGATVEKIQEITKLLDFTRNYVSSEIDVIVLNFGSKLESKLDAFKPEYYISGEEIEKTEHIDNLLYTIELNPVEEVIVRLPDGKEYFITDGEEYDETVDRCLDTMDKLKDIVDTIRSGKEIDSMQEAFLNAHNIL